ncbi:MAG: hypothetical protein HY861_02335 [Chlamydiia bacterium]|nr:hypothetical protein [Chlamydiia bacterium]
MLSSYHTLVKEISIFSCNRPSFADIISPVNRSILCCATASFVFLLCPFFAAFAAEIIVDLRNPTYKNFVLQTTEGGVIKNSEIRIQAQNIEYTRSMEQETPIHRIYASGDLMIQYNGKVFTGNRLEYDFIAHSGTVYQGKTFSSLWYIGGEKIDLKSDGSYEVENASITSSENKDSFWDLFATKVEALNHDLFISKNVQFRLFKVPTFWLPSLKLNLKKSHDPIIRYTLNWDKGQGPRVGARCQLYSWQDFSLFGRLEYRWSTGWGGAVETEYFPPQGQATCVTRSYVGTDRLETAPNKQFRFRLEGAHHWSSLNGKTSSALTWDKYSDVRMPSDFKSEDFEVGAAKQTLFWVHHQEPFAIVNFKTRPRVNLFESIKQDLPTLYLHFLPRTIGPFGILSSLWAKASYLDFAYSDQLASGGLPSPTDYRSGRFEVREKLQVPLHWGPCVVTPNVGAIGILYTNSASHQVKPLGLFTYGLDIAARARRAYSASQHVVEPYASLASLTKPTVSPDAHYIFSIQDGYNQINQIQAGIRNQIFSIERVSRGSWFTADLYANAFFSDPTIPQFIPRLYLLLSWNLPSLDVSIHNAWNFRNQVLDFFNARARWTISENIALTVEGRYRSEYDWRKADHENFILDVTRSETQLLLSPLSDRRITILSDLFIRLSPFWECHLQSHHGFYRFTEDPYNEFKIDLFTWITTALKLRISYSHTDKDDRVTGGISLIKK